MPDIIPFILGSGLSGQAIAKSLNMLRLEPDFQELGTPVFLERDADLRKMRSSVDRAVLFIANPHGLHAETIVKAEAGGFSHIVCEKPACVAAQQGAMLRSVKATVAILHGYREMWGVREMKRRVLAGEVGELMTIEGRYWQSSVAERSLQNNPEPRAAWKKDPKLAGDFDVLLDLGTHWVDLAAWIVGEVPLQIKRSLFYSSKTANAYDSHNHLYLYFSSRVRGLASVSKAVHGAANDLELTVIGTKGSLTWRFLDPDHLEIGRGHDREVLARREKRLGSTLPQFHGLGWLEGYVQICREVLREVTTGTPGTYPRLAESLDLLEMILSSSEL